MTNVSKQVIDASVSQEIWQQLSEALGRLSATQATPFLQALLTPAEQIMLAKRLAAIVLIHEAHSSYAIAETLKMSYATISKLRIGYEESQYNAVVVGIKKNKTDYTQFVEVLIDAIHLGLPRYAGPNRWKFLKE